MKPQLVMAILLVVSQSSGGPVMVGYAEAGAARDFSQDTMNRGARLRWFFAHASVGENLMRGITLLNQENSTFFQLQRSSVTNFPLGRTQPAIIYDDNRGNPGWQAKVDLFAGYVGYGWRAPKVDIALNKYCWIDNNADLQYYVDSMSTLEANNPQTWFVYATIPLDPSESYENYQRSVYNNSLRDWVRTNNRILYDIADIEAHDTNGVEQTFLYNGYVCQKEFDGYTFDGGHLNTVEAVEKAALGFYAIAAALRDADRDGDGMPDWWENANGLNPLDASDAAADPDSDGMTNLEEYRAGTDPHNPASVLALQPLYVPSIGLNLQFVAASNVSYSVQCCGDLAGGDWTVLTNIPPSSSERTMMVFDSEMGGQAVRFYRISARRSL